MNTLDYYKNVFKSFAADGMSDSYAKLEVIGRIIQDADASQFDEAVELIDRFKTIRYCDEHNEVEEK